MNQHLAVLSLVCREAFKRPKPALRSMDNSSIMSIILTNNIQDLQMMVQAAYGQSDKFGLKLIISKTQCMIVSRAKILYANTTLTINNKKGKGFQVCLLSSLYQLRLKVL